jgi:hypothetical protein
MIISDAMIWSSFTSVIYDHNDSGQYCKTMIMIVSYAPNQALDLAMIVNDATIRSTFTSVIYDWYDSGQYFMIVSYAPNLALALANVINYDCE